MMTKEETDYLSERMLKKLNPDLYSRYKNTPFVMNKILDRFQVLFPEYTDHTLLHCVTVTDFCNVLIRDQIKIMNDDELYVLLMAAYLHDSGMAMREKEVEAFKEEIPYGDYFVTHPDASVADFLRDFHHEFSGVFIRQYAGMFDIPSDEHVTAIVQVSRGHRRTDLYDENEYSAEFTVPGGNTICLPYLSALIRLSDEIDVVASRNPLLLYDIDALENATSIMEHLKHKVIRSLITTEDAFTMCVYTEDAELIKQIESMRDKMQRTLDYCRDVVEKRTKYRITQKHVEMRLMHD
jgi:hypothetical protein